MARQIKFRVWDGEKFLYSYAEKGESFKYSKEYVGVDWFIQCQRLESSTRFWVQQYTGLLDKNGQEIYEGDIVLAHNCHYPYDVLQCVVEFSEHSASFFLRHVKESNVSLSFSHCGSRVNTEVIGNIFEDASVLS